MLPLNVFAILVTLELPVAFTIVMTTTIPAIPLVSADKTELAFVNCLNFNYRIIIAKALTALKHHTSVLAGIVSTPSAPVFLVTQVLLVNSMIVRQIRIRVIPLVLAGQMGLVPVIPQITSNLTVIVDGSIVTLLQISALAASALRINASVILDIQE